MLHLTSPSYITALYVNFNKGNVYFPKVNEYYEWTYEKSIGFLIGTYTGSIESYIDGWIGIHDGTGVRSALQSGSNSSILTTYRFSMYLNKKDDTNFS